MIPVMDFEHCLKTVFNESKVTKVDPLSQPTQEPLPVLQPQDTPGQICTLRVRAVLGNVPFLFLHHRHEKSRKRHLFILSFT